MNRGIYLVANRRSEDECANLIYAIRKSGCALPIRLIPFGGAPVRDPSVLAQTEPAPLECFSEEGRALLRRIAEVLPRANHGLFRRLLIWFGDWDEFIYSDNDVVALMNWEELFQYLPGRDFVHSDGEYTTGGVYNYPAPDYVSRQFGSDAIETAFTTGHFLSRKEARFTAHFHAAADWYVRHPGKAFPVDGPFLHLATLLGKWNVLNLCKPPHSWIDPWAGNYANTLEVVQNIQQGHRMAHIHYSGWKPMLTKPQEDFLTAGMTPSRRLFKLWIAALYKFSGANTLSRLWLKIRRHLNR